MLVSLAFAPLAAAQTCGTGWTCNEVFAGTSGTDIPTAAVTRAWGPADEVYFAYERRFPAATDDPHELYLQAWTCSGSSCTSPTPLEAEEQIGNAILFDQSMGPTMSVYNNSGTRELDFVLRDRAVRTAPSCGSATVDYADASSSDPLAMDLDLTHVAWTPAGQTVNTFMSTTSSPCADRGAPSGRTYPPGGSNAGKVAACFRFNDRNGGLDKILCGKEVTLSPPAYAFTTLPNNAGTWRQEHVSMNLDGADRIAIHRSRESNQWAIRVRFVDDATDPSVVLDTGVDLNYADLSVTDNGQYAAVWEEEAGATDYIWSAWCDPALVDCTVAGNWEIDQVTSGDGVQHAHLLTDDDRQLVAYMEDIDSSANDTWRVKFKYRCADGAWSATADPETPSDAGWDQSLFSGRYAMSADRGDNVVHIAFVEMDDFLRTGPPPEDGNVRWVSRSYTDCP